MLNFEDDIKNCVGVLEEGGVILYPTDTIWGLGCDALNETAIDKIFALKDRPKEKSLIVLLAEAREVLQYVAAPHPDIMDIIENFSTPTTVIYEGALGFPDNLIHEDGSIAIRVTTDPFCKALIKRFRKPIVSTSANLSGQTAPKKFYDIDPILIQRADYVVKHRQQDQSEARPSRIVRILDNGEPEILRG